MVTLIGLCNLRSVQQKDNVENKGDYDLTRLCPALAFWLFRGTLTNVQGMIVWV